ncbi:MAG: formylmethanofuran dehydrogenase subunit E family protein, partial [candidate division WOR-3 bacterium]
MDSTYILEAAGRFHGHIGPWLALGVRAGLRAWEKLGVRYQDLVACVRCPDRTPYTCFLDGIQFSSGCTMGKGNIRHQAAEGC